MIYLQLFNRDNQSQAKRFRNFRNTILILLLFMLLVSCERSPFNITKFDVSPDPVVGEVVTLSVKIESENEEPDVSLKIELPEGVQLVSGSTEWDGSLPANGTYTHNISICVRYEGEWRIVAEARYWPPTGRGGLYGDASDTLYLESTQNSGKVIPSWKYSPENETWEATATPLPKLTTPVCPESSETE